MFLKWDKSLRQWEDGSSVSEYREDCASVVDLLSMKIALVPGENIGRDARFSVPADKDEQETLLAPSWSEGASY
jgi:hypothetical protein